MRRLLFALLAILAIGAATAQSPPLQGVDYHAVGTDGAAQANESVEVLYFFWYRCPHCYALEPLVEPWRTRLPKHVHFTRVPAVLGKEWLLDARVFYSLEAIGELERVHRPLLDAIHNEGGRRLDRKPYTDWVASWLEKHGVDRKAYAAAYDSSVVGEKVRKAAEMAKAYHVEATPSFVVGQRYVASPPLGDRRRILQTADYLVSQVQAGTAFRR
jgi:protein dithiol oxidoreductase (disulfide-forming)